MLSCSAIVTPCSVTHQALLSIGLSWQQYWSGLPFPSLGDLPSPGTELMSPSSQVDSFPLRRLEAHESAICIPIFPSLWISFPFRSPWSTEQSPLRCIVGSRQLSILCMVLIRYICQSQFIPCSCCPFGFLYSFTSNRRSRHVVTSNHSLFTLLDHQRARSHFCFPHSRPGVEPAGEPFLMPVFEQHVSSVDFYFF